MASITKEGMLKQNPNITSKEMEIGLAMMKKFMNPLIVFPVTIAMYSFIGLYLNCCWCDCKKCKSSKLLINESIDTHTAS
jgi:hypothetical protein